MKKFTAMVMTGMMALSLAGCSSAKGNTAAEPQTTAVEISTEEAELESVADAAAETEKPETIVIQGLDGNRELTEVEVPYDPERIAILDMPTLDIIDALELGDRVVGSAKVTIEYLTQYNPEDSDGAIANLGSVKTADLEQVAISEPDVIFIGGRLSESYDALSAIAPVVYLAVDYEKGVVESTEENAKTIASIFGKEAEIEEMMDGFQDRIEALRPVVEEKNILLSMYNNNALSILDTKSQLNILAKELRGNNLGETIGETEKATHGEDASWETIVKLDPEYLFVLDRSTATGAAEEGVMGAREVIENDLIKELDVYKDGKIVYFIQNANVWYTATGGIQALDVMLSDLEEALLQK